MSFRISGLSPEPFRHLFGMSEAELKKHGAIRYVADADSGFPDRVEIRDVSPGETVLLLNHTSQPADTPYKATHAIFVREGATDAYSGLNEVPEAMRKRLLSLRGFDSAHMLIEADVVEGAEAKDVIERFFRNPNISYIHAHNAREGCYWGRIDRA